uniref:Nitrogenase iron protein n=2 Tax=Onchocerca ochengi TaxID=42157 RepID=A0A182F0G0_ONCOC
RRTVKLVTHLARRDVGIGQQAVGLAAHLEGVPGLGIARQAHFHVHLAADLGVADGAVVVHVFGDDHGRRTGRGGVAHGGAVAARQRDVARRVHDGGGH